MVIDRSVLEEITQDIVQKTLDICGRALSIAGREGPQGGRSPLTVTAVDNVFLVGGTTLLAFVEERVAAYFGRAPIAGPRREDAVVLGCPSSNDLRLFGLWKNGVSGSARILI